MSSPREQADLVSTQSLLNDHDISYLKELVVPDNPRIDLVAVHGLRIPVNFAPWRDAKSFGVKTWAAGDTGNEKLWLKDFLPHDIEGLRVLLFGYNSNIGWDVSTAGVSGAADDLLLKLKNKRASDPERPVIFVCHSLGGIVVKHAIAKARSNAKYENIFKSVRGIAFFATPHRGGLAAKHGAAVAGGLRHVTRNPRSSIMEALRADSLISFDIHQYFLHSLTRIRVCSFYEMKPLPGIGRLVVNKNSALLGLPYPQEDAVSVPESDHSSICKFDRRSQNYDLAKSGITDLCEWASNGASTIEPCLTPPPNSLAFSNTDEDLGSRFDLPYRESRVSYAYLPDFDRLDRSNSADTTSQTSSFEPMYLWPSLPFERLIGRKGLMDSIQETLSTKRSHQTRLALYGLGGVGKTQIALHMIECYKTDHSDESIFWIHGGSADTLRQSLTEIGFRRKLLKQEAIGTEPLDAVRHHLLNEDNGRWLMVVDNADNPDTFFKPASVSAGIQQDSAKPHKIALGTYIPRCPHGRIVFTTNNKALGEKLSMHGSVVEIPHLGLAEACEMLRKRLFEDTHSGENPPSYQREVPPMSDMAKLCDYLDCLPLALTQAAAFLRQQNVTVSEYTQLLNHDESRLSELLANNFQASGLDDEFSKAIESTWNVTFDRISADVPVAAELLSFMAFLDSKNIPRFLLRHVVVNEWDLTVTGLGTLQSYALVALASNGDNFSIHRLVQHAMRKRLASAQKGTDWSRKALAVLSEQFPSGEYESWETCAALLPHALHVLKINRSKQSEDLLLVATLQFKISQYYAKLGLYSRTAELSQETLETLAESPNAPKSLIYRARSVRVLALKNHGQLQEAEKLAKEVWHEQQHELGAKHIDTLDSFNILAVMYQEQGKFDESLKAARHLIKGVRKIAKDDDILLQSAKRRLGTILHKLGEYTEAEALLREALVGYTAQLGPDDGLTLKTKWRLAWILHDQGKYAEAEQTSFETWTTQKKTIGEDHPDCLQALYLYADDLQAQSKFETAMTYKRHVHTRAIALVGARHRYTLTAASSLASCLVASVTEVGPCAAYGEASELYKAVLRGREESLRQDHPETLSARSDVAQMLRLNGSPKEAELLERETLKKAKAALEKHHPIVLDCREGLARILWAQRESKEAIEQIKKVLKLKEKRYGWDFVGTRHTATLLAQMLPDGKERARLKEKITKSSNGVRTESTSQETLSMKEDSASGASGNVEGSGIIYQDMDKKGKGERSDDAWFNS